jgi:nucleoside-diphosphate-sugar epimerase
MAIKVLLVGGNGFIGSAIHLSLLKNNLIVFPTSRELTSIKRGFRKLNILDDSTWDFLKTEIKPEIVICTAWETTHNMYWQQKINYEFAEAVKKFSSFCFSIGVHRFIGIGSMSEYGFSPGSCNSLTTQVNPQDPYSETKVLASVNLDNVSKIYGRKANWVRIFHPYGTKENPRRLVPSLLRDMSNRVTVNINYPDHFLDFIHIDDVARAFTEIAIGNYEYSINLGTGVPTSVRN